MNNFNKLTCFFCALLMLQSSLFALEKPKEELGEVGVVTELGSTIDLSLKFRDSNDRLRPLSEVVLQNKPLIIVPAYYQCPRLCGLLLRGVTKLLSDLKLEMGQDYSVITVSFNEKEKFSLAAKRKAEYIAKLPETMQSAAQRSWNFFVGDQENIHKFMNQIGFQFRPDKGEFAHSAAIMILTPGAQISQYFTGISFSPFDTKLALVEASQGGIGSALDHVLLYCFRFDPTKGKYTWAAYGLMQVGGAITLLLFAGLVFKLLRKEKLQKKALQDE